ncbi:hypothetical protein [Couchioplanes caeruleus]|uniref:DUF1542 domain-containing protein n=2 Tax=Couchioplanes caeruleus TaxID=56438 RepID=A0A1K0GBW5_9ACTN|nr:hypothetical protein [Couchioplanes caeruleus]OJF09662.1 hypothetical protein BG844_36465 [Couchioplanes caeruleus subsp. caeruleus]ROP31961.1 hypothetical protein EDD30_4889 [Couchioplanes caeruleus]
MKVFLLLILVLVVVAAVVAWRRGSAARERRQLDDARAEAQRWYERLGGQVMNLHGDDPAARQALADAGERYNAAGGQLQQAKTVRQCELARESALEGLAYVRAARTAMGIDPGPELPPLHGAQGAGRLTREREVTVQGQHYRAGPQPGPETPHYYPGGRIQGRPVPSGWYSTPVWKTALGAGAGALGGMLIFDALLSPGFGDMGFTEGYEEGFQDAAGDFGQGDWDGQGDWGGGDFGGDI